MSAARAAALAAIRAVAADGRSLDAALDRPGALPDAPRERALARELAFGTLRWRPRLEALLDLLLDRPLRRRDSALRLVVALGLYQLLYTRIPAHAAVSETVALARAGGWGHATGLVNAILRRVLRERAALETRLDAQPATRHGYPEWLVERTRAAWPERWEEVLAAGNRRAPMTLRVNLTRLPRERFIEQLDEVGIEGAATRWSAAGVALAQPCDVDQLPGFAAGTVSVQDEAAQLAAAQLDAQPGERVLDACAAPGGKCAHLLERTPGLGELVAVERSRARAARMRASLGRLGLAATLAEADATEPGLWWDGRHFDRILLDAPCTATGVIRRHPDVKTLRRPADVARLAETQHGLLDALWPLLKPGGKLLYATCSVLPEENERVVARFVAAREDARPKPLEARWGRGTGLGRQILPGEDAMDGFYYAVIERHG